MNSFRIYGGKIVTPEAVIENGTVTVDSGKIVDIGATALLRSGPDDIDVRGQWIFPGIVDSHSDAIETEIQPRVRSLFPVEQAFRELERKLAGQGITTMYHALGLADANAKSAVRNKDTIEEIVSAAHRLQHEGALIRHRIHLRFEITKLEMVEFVERLLADKHVHQLSFTDHTPGQGQFRNLALFRENAIRQQKIQEGEAEHYVSKQLDKEKVDASKLKEIADLAYRQGIPIASHDDDTMDKLNWVEQLHSRISEFPIELSVAKEARRRGMYVAMGAPNLLLGHSTSNNLSAQDAIKEDAVDFLCSDYYPPSLLLAAFKLYRLGYDMSYAANLVSLNPAKALGIDQATGSLELGKAADILVVDERNGHPFITHTLVEGRCVSKLNDRLTVAQIEV
ncbi:alpha-D-ribose 1-methylphosphonate 5-triphosphate diphosphatase [Paenibacillus periandrae]|uniref:alpha-D-ribose 1-methylphosphonate 5-triphosphate diphosphatase n=1 Tax=Paenibacillus periandrae TaxID=1761741 RepID=UPI001F09ADCC|nr:alpha-D-ribose 1-methylphosphonate 5-triphosphate diphosphatase [Paenibacillus periandrae]